MVAVSLILSMVLAVQEDKDLESVLRLFNRGYSSADPKARASAVAELSKTPHEKTLARLAPLLAGESREIRIAAARGLGNYQEFKKQATPALLGALAAYPKDLDLRESIFASLGALQDESALSVIHQNFRGPQMRVARAAIGAAAAIRGKDSLPVLLDLLHDLQKWLKGNHSGGYKEEGGSAEPPAQKARLGELLGLTIKALQAITREPWTTAGEWELWSRKHLPTFTVPK
jgi:HEAT repeat protein